MSKPEKSVTFEEPREQTHLNLMTINQTHPLSHIQQPDMLNSDPNSFFDIISRILYAAAPTMICFELNLVTTFINIYYIGSRLG